MKQLRKNQIEVIKELMKDVDFEDLKANHAIVRNERNLKKELKEIEEDVKSQEKMEERVKAMFMSNTVPYEISFYKIKKLPEKEELTVREAFLLQLFAENPKNYPSKESSQTERSDFSLALALAYEVKDVKFKKEVALKIAANIIRMMETDEQFKQEEIYEKKLQRDQEFELLRVSLYKKNKEGNPELDKDGNPQWEDEEQAEKKLKAFGKKYEKLMKDYQKWFDKEQVTLSYEPISIEDLPEKITKKQMEVLLPFIKEEE